ncbi:MAG: toluene monooxygenase [Panacagrimonas sp.]|jgi:toluene monooxygenase system protein E|nr:toluene monooxygenase [Panacagrimonas sp.]MCC2657931.1 toluene monooxygenase [Panacagrimonas sp.]
MSTQPTSAAEPLKPLRTWSHLAGQRKQPSEYEIVSVNNIFRANPNDKVELSPDVPMNRWYRKYRLQSRLQVDDWNAFRDPEAVTYRAYCTQRDRDEVYVDGLLSQHAEREHDKNLSPAWVDQLAALYTPMRYLVHTAQMATGYAVSLCGGSTVANCLAFQMADQFRWMSRVAYRTAELRSRWPQQNFGQQERACWEKAPAWQGYRELMERVLATYDWGESILALNLVAMPAIDVALEQLRDDARARGDSLTGFLIEAQLQDSARRNRWMKAFMAFVGTRPDNVAFAEEVVARWTPLAQRAAHAYGKAIRPGGGERAQAAFDAAKNFH